MLETFPDPALAPEQATKSFCLEALVIGCIMSVCLVMLSHSTNYLSNEADLSVEAGAGLHSQQRFEGNVNAAPWNKKVGFLGYALVGVYCFLTSFGRGRIEWSMTLFFAFVYFGLICLSVLWSIHPDETLRELVRIAVYLFVAVSIARKHSPRDVAMILFVMALGSVAAACAASVATGNFQPWRGDFRLHGTIHSNALAGLGLVATLASASFAGITPRRTFWLCVAGGLLTVVVLTKTRGVLAATLFGLLALYLIRRSVSSNLLVVSSGLIGVCLLVGGVLFGGQALQHEMESSLALGRSEDISSLTGRLPLWKTLWKEAKEHRVLGFGYGAFYNTDQIQKLSRQLEWFPGHSHSAYVHTMMDLGFVGVGVLACLVVSTLWRCKRLLAQGADEVYQFYFALFSAGIVHGLTEVEFIYPRGLGFFVATALFGILYHHRVAPSEAEERVDELAAGTTLPWTQGFALTHSI